MAVTRTSKEAYYKVKLGKNQQAVLDALGEMGVGSNQDIADKLGWTINRVTGRSKELRESGYIVQHGMKRNQFGNTVKTWCVTDPNAEVINLLDDELEEQTDYEKWIVTREQDKAIAWLAD